MLEEVLQLLVVNDVHVCPCGICLLLSLREKAQLQADIQQKQEMVQQRKEEIVTLQGELDSSTHQRQQLEKQKNEAQTELDNLISEVSVHVCLCASLSLSLSLSLYKCYSSVFEF